MVALLRKACVSGKLKHMGKQLDFLKRHAIFSSFCLFLLMEIAGHILWLRGVIPDNNTGGNILYLYVPQAWLVDHHYSGGKKILLTQCAQHVFLAACSSSLGQGFLWFAGAAQL
jgi:hypothetical protein